MKHSVRQIQKKELEIVESLYFKNRESLELYADLLLWWNNKINLVSRGVSRETVIMHIRHSLFFSVFGSFRSGRRVLDTGAGGGLPGIPLSVCFPEKKIEINDIVSKKIFAVNDMVNKLGLSSRVKGVAKDVSSVDIAEGCVVVTKHAFKIEELYRFIEDKPWSRIIFLKGFKESLEEVEKIEDEVKLNLIKLDSGFMNSFYNGKAVVELVRSINE